MLRLSALTLGGLILSFLIFGGELSPAEKAELESLRAQRTSIVTMMSDAFTDTSQRTPTYVARLAQFDSGDKDLTNTSVVQLANYTPEPSGPKPQIVSTTVADPAKLAALMAPAAHQNANTGLDDMILRTVTATRVNVRSGPSTSNAVLGQVVRSDIVRVMSNPDDEWVKIIIEGDGIEGYMSARFLTDAQE
jgi:uncharacterized protein YgiM (DUF1202 family)